MSMVKHPQVGWAAERDVLKGQPGNGRGLALGSVRAMNADREAASVSLPPWHLNPRRIRRCLLDPLRSDELDVLVDLGQRDHRIDRREP